MLAIHTLFEHRESHIILQETLVDNMLDIIQLVSKETPSRQLIVRLGKIFDQKYKINIDFVRNQNNSLEGQFIRPNTIEILFPKNITSFNQINQKHLIHVLLHEFSHFITDAKIPKLITVKHQSKQQLAQQLVPPSQNIMFNDNFKNVKQKLDYVLHIRELPNFAFSIAVSMHFYKKPNSFEENKIVVDQYFMDHKQIQRNGYYALLRGDIKELYEIQHFVRYVKEINNKQYLKYSRKLIKFRKLIKKYYRRLAIYYR